MKTQQDKDLVMGVVLLIVNLLAYVELSKIRWGNDRFMYSAAALPISINVLFTILCIALIGSSIKKGASMNFGEIGAWVKEGVRTRQFRVVMTAMVSIAALVFLGVPYVGFFISGGIFMFCILFFFVKSLKPLYSALITAISLGAIYGIFIQLFRIPLS